MAERDEPPPLDDDRALSGRRVVVPRAEDGTSRLAERLEALGAEAVVVPLVEIGDLVGPDDVAAVVGTLGATEWVVVSSPRGARAVRAALARRPEVRVAAVGAATADELERVDLVPARQSAAGLVEVFPDASSASPADRVVVVQAAGGASTLVEGLTARGWAVTRLDTHVSRPLPLGARTQLEILRADAVVFTSGSQARAWADTLGSATPPVVVAIGPQTAADIAAAGLSVTAVATDHSLDGLLGTLAATLRAG